MVQDFWPCVGKSWQLRFYPQFHLSPDAMTMPIMAILTQCLSFIFPFSCHTCPFFYPKGKSSSHIFYWGLGTCTLYCYCLVLCSYCLSPSSSYLLFHPTSLYFKFLFFLPLSFHSTVPKNNNLCRPILHSLSHHIIYCLPIFLDINKKGNFSN